LRPANDDSPFTPYTALKLVELAQEIFPPGVVQVVGGSNELGAMLTAHPGIAKISFTGSIATGKKVMEACAKTLKRITLELGGNDASIILPDVDIEKVAPEVAMGAFQNSGQVRNRGNYQSQPRNSTVNPTLGLRSDEANLHSPRYLQPIC
jgi:acyl-CoA reductase-like NAD-dependent aldehyde dehydrogenase